MIKTAYWLPNSVPLKRIKTVSAAVEPPILEGVVCSGCGWLGLPEDRRCWICGQELPNKAAKRHFITSLTNLESLFFRPFPHQIAAALQVLGQMHGTALLCDEVGLGKTVEAGLIMRELITRGLVKSVLILVPAGLLMQWAEELNSKFGIAAQIVRHVTHWDKMADAEPQAVYLISHDLARRMPHADRIKHLSWDLLVVDEAHKLKNSRTILHRLLKSVESSYRLLLTATPIQNNLMELYSLVTLIDDDHFGSLKDFKADFIEGRDSRSPKNVMALRRSLRDVMIRQTRLEAQVNWVQRRAGVIEIELPEEEADLYQAVTQYIRGQLRATGERKNLLTLLLLQKEVSSSPQALAKTLQTLIADPNRTEEDRSNLQNLIQLASAIRRSAKIEAIVQLIKASTEKFLIFSDYVQTVFALRTALEETGISVRVFYGGLSLAEKEKTIEEFRTDCQVLLSTESGSEGKNLQFCHQVINVDLPWNPMKLEQRIGRVHRLGQKQNVSIYTVVAHDTIETYILDLLAKKIRLFELVVGELDLILGNLDRKRSLEELLIEVWKESQTDEQLKQGFAKLGGKATRARKSFSKLKQEESKFWDILNLHSQKE